MTDFPGFQPHPLLRGGHRQTLFSFFLRGTGYSAGTMQHAIEIPDGDRLILHDNPPKHWATGDPVAVLLHGLAGCHGSAYMVRVGEKLAARGVRAFRLDHRGCGAGTHLARFPYNAGRSDDVRLALKTIHTICPASPSAVVGFSLSGNIALKMLGEDGSQSNAAPPPVTCAVAVNPPIDLALCGAALAQRQNRIYERHFIKLLCRQVAQRISHFPDAPRPVWHSPPRRLREFDDAYTAPASGFNGVKDYYEQCSGHQFVASIRVPTLILTARDDPLIPARSFQSIATPYVKTVITAHGGHLGYIGRQTGDPDRRWMDWRIVDWLENHFSA
ncbi:MAG: alpha/beta fold hydrolase [Planctomycetaceae bacterium]